MIRALFTGRTVGLVGTAVAVASVAFFVDADGLFDEDGAEPTVVVRDTATIERTTLSVDYEAEGTLSYASAVSAFVIAPPGDETTTTSGSGRGATTEVVVTPASMVVTELVPEGAVVEEGAVLWRLGNEPSVLLYGDEASYRDLEEGDTGADVMQLESALVRLGHDPDGTVTVDEEFTAATEAMVERWQEAVGAAVDGVVHHGSVVHAPGPSLVGDGQLSVGDTAFDGGAAFELSSLVPEVSFLVTASDRDDLAVGDTVTVRTADQAFEATVTAMTVTDDGGASVRAAPAADVDLASDTVPADVRWEVDVAVDVVTVPAEAILRTDDQRRWVEVRDDSGAETWVEVAVGQVSNGRAEVEGELTVGDAVITP